MGGCGTLVVWVLLYCPMHTLDLNGMAVISTLPLDECVVVFATLSPRSQTSVYNSMPEKGGIPPMWLPVATVLKCVPKL